MRSHLPWHVRVCICRVGYSLAMPSQTLRHRTTGFNCETLGPEDLR